MNEIIEHKEYTISDLEQMGKHIHASGLFEVKSPAQAITLLMLAASEGIHPVQAMRRFHVIQGKPSMRADAMLAEFIRRGGRVRWTKFDSEAAAAVFSKDGADTEICFTMLDAVRAGISTGANWKKYPDAMLRARLISKAVRMIDPGAVAGIYTPEEVSDFSPRPSERATEAQEAPEPIDITPEVLAPLECTDFAQEGKEYPETLDWLRAIPANRISKKVALAEMAEDYLRDNGIARGPGVPAILMIPLDVAKDLWYQLTGEQA